MEEKANPEEIIMDESDSEEEEELVSKVPDSVFGSLAQAEEEPMGAKDRFMKRKRE